MKRFLILFVVLFFYTLSISVRAQAVLPSVCNLNIVLYNCTEQEDAFTIIYEADNLSATNFKLLKLNEVSKDTLERKNKIDQERETNFNDTGIYETNSERADREQREYEEDLERIRLEEEELSTEIENNKDTYVGIEIAPTTPSDNWPVIPYGASYVSREYVDIFSWFSDSIPEGLQVEIDGSVVTLNEETRLDYITKIVNNYYFIEKCWEENGFGYECENTEQNIQIDDLNTGDENKVLYLDNPALINPYENSESGLSGDILITPEACWLPAKGWLKRGDGDCPGVDEEIKPDELLKKSEETAKKLEERRKELEEKNESPVSDGAVLRASGVESFENEQARLGCPDFATIRQEMEVAYPELTTNGSAEGKIEDFTIGQSWNGGYIVGDIRESMRAGRVDFIYTFSEERRKETLDTWANNRLKQLCEE